MAGQLAARKRYGKAKVRLQRENLELKARIRVLEAALEAATAAKGKRARAVAA